MHGNSGPHLPILSARHHARVEAAQPLIYLAPSNHRRRLYGEPESEALQPILQDPAFGLFQWRSPLLVAVLINRSMAAERPADLGMPLEKTAHFLIKAVANIIVAV